MTPWKVCAAASSIILIPSALYRLSVESSSQVPPPTRLALGNVSDGVGQQLPREIVGRLRGGDKPVMVALLSDCSSCSLKSIKPGMEPKGVYSAVVFVSNQPPKDWPENLRNVKPPYYTFFDKKGDLFRKLKANWTPRMYVSSPTGRIVQAEVGIGDEGVFRG